MLSEGHQIKLSDGPSCHNKSPQGSKEARYEDIAEHVSMFTENKAKRAFGSETLRKSQKNLHMATRILTNESLSALNICEDMYALTLLSVEFICTSPVAEG